MPQPADQPTGRWPTLIDVAREAGVSRATASRVLTGSPRVSPVARERVLESAERLNYRVNIAARSLRTDRTGLVGLLIPGFRNDLYGPIADELAARLRGHDLSLVLGSSDWSAAGDLRILESFTARGLEAMILAPSIDRSSALAAAITHLRTPVVLFDRELQGIHRDSVLIDGRSAIIESLGRLAALGHQRIAVTTYGPDLRPGREARGAFMDATAELALDDDPSLLLRMTGLHPGEGIDIADAIVTSRATAAVIGGPTALLATCLRRLRERLGRDAFPDRLSLIAIGDQLLGDLCDPPLAMVTRPVERIATALADLLVARILDPTDPVRTELIQLSLNPGASIGPLP